MPRACERIIACTEPIEERERNFLVIMHTLRSIGALAIEGSRWRLSQWQWKMRQG